MPERSRILEGVYETANDPHSAEIMNKRRLQTYEAIYQALQVPNIQNKSKHCVVACK